jgi:hypothetical protein
VRVRQSWIGLQLDRPATGAGMHIAGQDDLGGELVDVGGGQAARGRGEQQLAPPRQKQVGVGTMPKTVPIACSSHTGMDIGRWVTRYLYGRSITYTISAT